MKFKTAIAAAAILATGAAHAIDTTNTADLFLAVWDTTNTASYVLDLNQQAANTNFASGNYNFTVDSAYSSFLATSGLDASTLQWGVYAIDNQGLKTTKDDVKLYTTTTVGQAVVAKNNSGIGGAIAGASNLAGLFNTGSSTIAAYGTPSYADQYTLGALSNSLNGTTTGNAVGASSAFYEVGVSSGTGTKASDLYTLAGTWKFDGTNLTYSTTPAVPEASTYAMLIAGLAAIGFVARRRAA